jgi:hypothetical protein
MSLSRLTREADSLAIRFEAALSVFNWDTAPFDNWITREDRDLCRMFSAHCESQKKILKAVGNALTQTMEGHGDIVLFITGSLAKLEYILNVSDIDIFGMTTDDTHLKVQEELVRKRGKNDDINAFIANRNALIDKIVNYQTKFRKLNKAITDNVHTNVKNALKKQRLRKSKVEVSGLPFHGGEYFFTDGELYKNLGGFDEPVWAVSNRASLLFESAFFPSKRRVEEFAGTVRSEINGQYRISANLQEPDFPLLGSLLAVFLTKSGVLSKIAKLGTPHMREPLIVEERVLDSEILKTIVGRVWSSAVHIMLLHVLYWAARLLPVGDYSAKHLRLKLCRPPMRKLLVEIPETVSDILEEIRNNPNQIPGNEAQQENIRLALKEIFAFVSPSNEKRSLDPRSDGCQPAMPLASLYISFFLVAKRARERKKRITGKNYDHIVKLNFKLFEYLEKFERLTLLLVTNHGNTRTVDQMGLVRLFAAEILDRQLCVELLGGPLHSGRT